MLRPVHIVVLLSFLPLVSLGQTPHPDPEKEWISVYQYANKLYNGSHTSDKTDSLALISYQKVITILSKNGAHNDALFDAYVKAGILQLGGRDDRGTLNLFQNAIHVQQKNSSVPDSLLFQPYLFSGTSYYNLNELDSARDCYRRAEQLITKYPGTKETERLYNKYGALFYETGDYEKSIHYFTRALSIVQAHPSPDPYFVVNYKNNIASVYRKLGDNEQALGIYQALLPLHIRQDELLHNMGVVYLAQGKYIDAIHYLEKVSYQAISKSNDLASAWLSLKKPDSAAYWLGIADSQYQSQGAPAKNFDYAITLQRRAEWLMQKGFPNEALKKYQQGVIHIDPDFSDTAIDHNPSSFQGLHNLSVLFGLLTGKARTFLALHPREQDIGSRKNAFATYESALLLAAHVEKTYTTDESKLFLSKEVGPVYQDAVELALTLYADTKDQHWLEKAFSFSENSKAAVLQAGLQELSLATLPGLPEDFLLEERRLKAFLSKWNMELERTTDAGTSSTLQKKILDAEIRLSVVQDNLEQNPKYYQARFENKEIHPRDIQQNIIGRNEAVLSYYFLRDKLVCFYLSREEFGFRLIPWTEAQHMYIVAFRDLLRSQEGVDPKAVRSASRNLFELLVKPVMDKIKTKKRIIIIPHNEISFIPFECLQNAAEEMPLIRDFSFCYQYSINFLQNRKSFPEHQYEVLGMAPFTELNPKQDLPMLPASLSELDQLKGKILVGQQANKSAFVQYASNYPFIHLATHAYASDQNPLQSFIAFYGDSTEADTLRRLYEQEIYRLDLHSSRLVILSACETGSGHLIHGEGIMSLSRAFSYAGCPAVVTSMWKADDAATTFIIQRLHHYLNDGYLTDEALQLAKLDYLQSDQFEPRKKTPAFWAHLVLIGDNGQLYRKSYFALTG